MRRNGVDLAPTTSRGSGGGAATRIDGDSAAVRKATQACDKYRKDAFGELTDEQRQEFRDAFAKFSSCMRKQGIEVPAPPAAGGGSGGGGGRRAPAHRRQRQGAGGDGGLPQEPPPERGRRPGRDAHAAAPDRSGAGNERARTGATAPADHRRRGAVGLVAAAGTAALLATGSSGGETATASDATATTAIERRDLVEVQTEDGTLGYSDSRPVAGNLSGTVTWLPSAGSVVRTNTRLYEVDESRVYLLDGTIPAYRALGPGTEGGDVRALEVNLQALGMNAGGAMTVDGEWDAGHDGRRQALAGQPRPRGDGHDRARPRRLRARATGASRSSRSASGRARAPARAATGPTRARGAEVMTTTSTRRIVTVEARHDEERGRQAQRARLRRAALRRDRPRAHPAGRQDGRAGDERRRAARRLADGAADDRAHRPRDGDRPGPGQRAPGAQPRPGRPRDPRHGAAGAQRRAVRRRGRRRASSGASCR